MCVCVAEALWKAECVQQKVYFYVWPWVILCIQMLRGSLHTVFLPDKKLYQSVHTVCVFDLFSRGDNELIMEGHETEIKE